jgi:hypothetical protein
MWVLLKQSRFLLSLLKPSQNDLDWANREKIVISEFFLRATFSKSPGEDSGVQLDVIGQRYLGSSKTRVPGSKRFCSGGTDFLSHHFVSFFQTHPFSELSRPTMLLFVPLLPPSARSCRGRPSRIYWSDSGRWRSALLQ